MSRRPPLRRALRDLAEQAESQFCDHPAGEHGRGECDLLLITPQDITQLLEEGVDRGRVG